ncbi:MAG: asparagine synthase C-terminal domain-containing protein, partial [Candidatus Pacebacteria bacterium]|nr:asparagine synthase C-terminal domain-containing protein [Candidatus Paceibacterota bacterium]
KEGKLEFMKYWDESENSSIKNKDELLEKTKAVITESVKRQLVSDKPLGVYLSGGLDSSIILHSMSEKHVDIDTFSVGFELSKEEQADKFNADFFLAKRTAKHYGTKHHEILLSPSDVVELFGESVWHSDEPIANPTALARLKIARFAKENVDVVLAGDGGDELFGGYDRYRLSHAADLWQKYTPGIIRSLLSVNERLRKLNTPPGVSRYGLFMFQKNPVLKEVLKDEYINTTTANYFEERYFKASQDDSFTHNFLFADRKSWLVDESLILSDKMSMASGIEMRVPFLDPEVIQFSQSVPEHLKVSSFDTKILLKEAYRSSLPEYLFKEPKRGWFSPSAKWLRNEDVYEFAKEVLSSGYYKETENIFKWEGVQSMLEDHRARKRYNLSILWALMVFQVWARRFDVSG